MDIYQVRSFIILAEQLHFGRAARLLHLSQPALTKQIRRMEADLGCELFERGKHGTRLSTYGQEFLVQARELMSRFDSLVENARHAASGLSGRLRIGFGYHTLRLVPRLVVELRAIAPGIQVTLRDMSTAEQVMALNEGQIDLGFGRLPLPAAFETLPVAEDRLALVSSLGYRKKGLELGDCRNEPFVTISKVRSPGFHNHLLRLCAEKGFHPRVVQECAEFTTVLALVRAGMGLAVIPESFWDEGMSGLRLHRLAAGSAAWKVGAAWRRRDANPALHRFLELVKANARSAL